MLLVLLAAAAAAPNPASIDAPRRAFVTCIRQFEARSVTDKIAPTAYADAVKAACAAESAALSKALVSYDVGMGTKRSTAASNAETDVEDYFVSSSERFRDKMAPQ